MGHRCIAKQPVVISGDGNSLLAAKTKGAQPQ
jgi:hypothetical protein